MTSPETIKKTYERNLIQDLHKKNENPDDYMAHVLREIDLEQLYKVQDYLYIDKDQEICAVVLEIKHTELLVEECKSF